MASSYFQNFGTIEPANLTPPGRLSECSVMGSSRGPWATTVIDHTKACQMRQVNCKELTKVCDRGWRIWNVMFTPQVAGDACLENRACGNICNLHRTLWHQSIFRYGEEFLDMIDMASRPRLPLNYINRNWLPITSSAWTLNQFIKSLYFNPLNYIWFSSRQHFSPSRSPSWSPRLLSFLLLPRPRLLRLNSSNTKMKKSWFLWKAWRKKPSRLLRLPLWSTSWPVLMIQPCGQIVEKMARVRINCWLCICIVLTLD